MTLHKFHHGTYSKRRMFDDQGTFPNVIVVLFIEPCLQQYTYKVVPLYWILVENIVVIDPIG